MQEEARDQAALERIEKEQGRQDYLALQDKKKRANKEKDKKEYLKLFHQAKNTVRDQVIARMDKKTRASRKGRNALVRREEEKFIRRQRYNQMKDIVVERKESRLLAQKSRQQQSQDRYIQRTLENLAVDSPDNLEKVRSHLQDRKVAHTKAHMQSLTKEVNRAKVPKW